MNINSNNQLDEREVPNIIIGDFSIKGWNEFILIEINLKGYIELTVSYKDRVYNLYFIDKVRLIQDLEAECGYSHLAIKGLVIVNEITLETVITAIEGMKRQGYFND